MPIYVKYGSITGDVTAAGHEKWIEVNSFQWGVGRGISSPTGGSADRESSAPSVSEIVVTKAADSVVVKLLDESLEGEGEDVTIDFCKTDKGKLEVYLSYTLTNTMISGFSHFERRRQTAGIALFQFHEDRGQYIDRDGGRGQNRYAGHGDIRHRSGQDCLTGRCAGMWP